VTEEHVSGRRWHSMGRRPRQVKKKVVGSVLRRFPTEDDGSVSWPAWRGSEAHEDDARWSAFWRLEHGGRESRVGRKLGGYCGKRREWASPSER
jgi:hypothetical protein